MTDLRKKRVKVSLSFNESILLKDVLQSKIIRLSEDSFDENKKKIVMLDKIDNKILKAINKNGIVFKWQKNPWQEKVEDK